MSCKVRVQLQLLERVAGDEDVHLGLEGGEGPLSPQLHLHVQQEVPGTLDVPVQVHGPRVGGQLPGAEVVLLVPLRDAEDDVVSGVDGRGSDAEDLRGDEDVGLEGEVVVGDSQRRVLTVQVVGTADPLTAPVTDTKRRNCYNPECNHFELFIPTATKTAAST